LTLALAWRNTAIFTVINAVLIRQFPGVAIRRARNERLQKNNPTTLLASDY